MATPSLPDQPASKAALLQELAEARAELYRILGELPEEARRIPKAVGAWSVQELCGHIAAWEDRLLTELQRLTQGDPVADGALLLAEHFCQDASFNRRQAQKRRGWPWREVLNELVWMREETGWTLANLSEAALFQEHRLGGPGEEPLLVSPAQIVRQLIRHDRLHSGEIRRWWEAQGEPPEGRKGARP